MDTLGLMVCECSKKDAEIIKLRVFVTEEELPIEQQFLWEESTVHWVPISNTKSSGNTYNKYQGVQARLNCGSSTWINFLKLY